MNKILLGNTGMEISRIFYGGLVSAKDGQDNSDKYVEFAIKNGVNYFDIAPTYDDAEEKLGPSLLPYRKDVFVACKTAQRGMEGAKKDLARSFELLKTDYFDNYQLHGLASIEEVEQAFAKDGAFNVLLKAKEEGIAKHLGITCHNEAAALRALELYDFETVLFPCNWGLNLAKDFGSKLSEKCKEKNIGFLGMKSMVHRAWNNKEERATSRFPKSWCMPFTDTDELAVAAMKYSLQVIGANALVPPGNIESFTFAVEHADKILKPITDAEMAMLKEALVKVDGRYFF